MHRVGLAVVQFTRSTSAEATAGRESLQPSALRARCTRKSSSSFHACQARRSSISRKYRQSVSGRVFAADAVKTGRIHAEMHRGRCSLVRLSDRPPPKRLPVGEPSTSGAPSSVQSGDYDPRRPASSALGSRFPLFATFSLQVAHTCVEPRVLYMGGTKVSPSRVRFRPLSRLTFRFRVQPSGRASSYSRPVLGAAAIYALQRAPARGSDDGKAANCERVGSGWTGNTSW